MSLTYSSMLPLGATVPSFKLEDVVSGNRFTPEDLMGTKGLVVMFICVHCPYVKHVEKEIARVADDYLQKGIGFVAISSNDINKYPDDAPEFMVAQAKNTGFNFPYLYDESQEVAKAYHAECTPDFFLFDSTYKCVYRGRLDEATPGNDKPVDGHDLRGAIENLLEGKPISQGQFPSMGCNIKWKS